MELTTALKRDLSRWIRERSIFQLDAERVRTPLQVIPVGFSREMIYGHLVNAFEVNGFVAVSIEHLDEIWRRPTDRMHHEEMRLMGRLDSLPTPPPLDPVPETMVDYLRTIPAEELAAIAFAIGSENADCFEKLGWIRSIEQRATETDDADDCDQPVVLMQCFTGSGRVDVDLAEIDIEDITSVETRSRYLEGYAHYFARTPNPLPYDPDE